MAFPLAAIGAGIGQFAQDYRQQQQDQIRTLMLQMQLAEYQRKLDADKRAEGVGDAAGDPSLWAVPGTQPAPVQSLPRQESTGFMQPQQGAGGPSALTGPPPSQWRQSQPQTGWRYTGYPFPTQGESSAFPALPTDTTAGNVTSGPGYPSQIGSSQAGPAIPPPSGGAPSPLLTSASTATTSFPQATPGQPVPAGGTPRAFQPGAPASPGAPTAGPQMAQAGPEPVAPIQPPTEQQLYQRALANEQAKNPGVAVPMSRRRLLAEAAKARAAGLQGQYKVENDRYKTEIDLWAKKQELGGSAETRAETARQNAASNRLRYDEITQRIREVDERERAGEATVEDQRDKSFLAHMKQKVEANTAASQDEDRRLQRILEKGRLEVSQQQANTSTARARAAVDKTKQKTDLAALELKSLINEAERLAALAQTNPNLVGMRGTAGRTVGGVTEQITGGRLPGVWGGKEADKFESEIRILREALQKPLQSQRYASKHATEQLQKLVPTLGVLDSPSQVAGALRNISRALQERLHNMEAASGAVADDVSKLTDDEILRGIGPGAASAGQEPQ